MTSAFYCDLKKYKEYVHVPIDECDVSRDILFSLGYCYCHGIILIGENEAGLAHILPGDSAKLSLEKMIKQFNSTIFGAVLIKSPASVHYGHNFEKECLELNIPVLQTFLRSKEYDVMHEIDVLVIPSEKEVRIYFDDGKIDKYKHLK